QITPCPLRRHGRRRTTCAQGIQTQSPAAEMMFAWIFDLPIGRGRRRRVVTDPRRAVTPYGAGVLPASRSLWVTRSCVTGWTRAVRRIRQITRCREEHVTDVRTR